MLDAEDMRRRVMMRRPAIETLGQVFGVVKLEG